MTQPASRSILRREATTTGLAATLTGTTAANVGCLLFNVAPSFSTGTVNRGIAGAGFIENTNAPGVAPSQGAWMNWTNDAGLGTMVSLLEPGRYLIKLDAVQTAAASLVYGISLNVTPGATAYNNLRAGVETSTGTFTTVAADQHPINLSTEIYVSPTMAGNERIAVSTSIAAINAQTNLTNHSTVRFHCSQAAGGPPLDAEILQTEFRATVRWMGPFEGA